MKHCACGAAPPPSIVRVDVRTSSMIHSIEFMCNRVFFLLAEPFPEDRGWSSEVKDRPTLARAWVWGRQACRRAETFWFNRGISNSIRPHSTRNAAIRFHERPQLKVIPKSPKRDPDAKISKILSFYNRARMKHNLNPVMNAQLDRNRRIRTHRRNLSDPRFSTSLTDSFGGEEDVRNFSLNASH